MCNGKYILSGSKDRSVQCWDPLTATSQFMLCGHKNSIISIASNSKKNLFATGSGDLKARVWKYDDVCKIDLSTYPIINDATISSPVSNFNDFTTPQ